MGNWSITPLARNGKLAADGQRLTYQRGPVLQEWFLNDPRGLEQGWTISQRPEGAGSGPIRLDLAVRGNLQPAVSETGVQFEDETGAPRLTYSGLRAWDADGRTLPARFVATEEGFAVEVDERGARYPVEIDPLAQSTYVKASNTEASDAFGSSIAVSGDTVVIGAIGEDSSATGVNGNQADIGATESGAVYVFVRRGNQWSQQAYLKASNTDMDDAFGDTLAISGNTLVVGAPQEDSNATGINGNQDDDTASSAGAAYVFVRVGSTWTQQAYLKASNTEAGDDFGVSVAISGETILVGSLDEASDTNGTAGGTAAQADNTAPGAGAVYVFTRTRNVWRQQAYLKASNSETSDNFGSAVAIAGDVAVVGAYGEDSMTNTVSSDPLEQGDNNATNTGAAYVFVRNGVQWSQQAYLKASSPGDDDRFGGALGISGDTIVVGALWEDSDANEIDGDATDNSATNAGAAYVFVRTGTQWSRQAYLKASNSDAQDWYGRRVAISGNTIAIGAHNEDSNAIGINSDGADNSIGDSGAAYVYTRTGSIWTQQAYLKANDTGGGDLFGSAVGVSGDLLVIGSPGEDSGSTGVNGDQGMSTNESGSGAAYFFTGFGPTLTSLAKTGESAPGAQDLAFGSPGWIAVTDQNSFACFETGLTGTWATGRERGVFAQTNGLVDLLLQKKDTLASFGNGYTALQTASVMSSLVSNQSTFGSLFLSTAAGPGITATNNRAVLRDTGTFLTLLDRTGQAPPGLTPAVSNTVQEMLQSFDTDLVVVTMNLRNGVGGISATNDSVLLPLDHDGSLLATTAPQEGGSAQVYTGNAADKLGQLTGRASASRGDFLFFTGAFIPSGLTGVPALFRIEKIGTTGALIAKQGDTANGTGGAAYSSFPAISQDGGVSLFRAMVSGTPVTENEGIWRGADLILQKGKPFDVANFPEIAVRRILRFWPAGTGQVVIHAVLSGTGVTAANNNALLLRQANGEFLSLIRTGDIAPGCQLSTVKVGSIQAVDVDPINGRYAVVGGLIGTAATANQALWGGKTTDGDDTLANRQLRCPTLRLRKGDAYSSSKTPRDVIRGISLKSFPDPTGAGGRGLGQAVSRRGLIGVTLTADRRLQELVTILP